jgi:hypothetical protein
LILGVKSPRSGEIFLDSFSPRSGEKFPETKKVYIWKKVEKKRCLRAWATETHFTVVVGRRI